MPRLWLCLLTLFVEVRLPTNVMLFLPSHLPVLSFKLDMEISCVVPVTKLKIIGFLDQFVK